MVVYTACFSRPEACSAQSFLALTLCAPVVQCGVQVQHKVTDAITSIDGELCFNIGVAAPLDANESEKMAWYV